MCIDVICIGGNLPVEVTLILGLSCIFADGVAFGMGEYLSSKAHSKYVQAERRRAQYDYKNYKDEEIRSLIELFISKGMSHPDAEVVVNKLSNYESLFVNLMITEGKGLVIPQDTEFDLCKDALVMFLSFAIFGSLPLIGMYAATYFDSSRHLNYAIALFIAVILMVIFGLVKSTFW